MARTRPKTKNGLKPSSQPKKRGRRPGATRSSSRPASPSAGRTDRVMVCPIKGSPAYRAAVKARCKDLGMKISDFYAASADSFLRRIGLDPLPERIEGRYRARIGDENEAGASGGGSEVSGQ